MGLFDYVEQQEAAQKEKERRQQRIVQSQQPPSCRVYRSDTKVLPFKLPEKQPWQRSEDGDR